jgi:signal transduction histidine kinase
MTARIAAGFLAVLAVVLIAVVVPLGIVVTRQRSADFAQQAGLAAASVAAVAEEHIDDGAPTSALHAMLQRFSAGGDRVAVLDASGAVIAHAGRALPTAVIEAAASRRTPEPIDDTVIAVAAVSDGDRALGTVVLARDTRPLDSRRNDLWLALTSAAVASLAAGAVIAWLLSRWISRPLTRLVRAVRDVGVPGERVLAEEASGPAQIREVASAFNAMTARVDSLLATQKDMTTEVSHQLRGPLAALRLRLEIHRDELPATSAAEISSMIDETGRLARMLDGLLAVARAEAAPSRPQVCDVAAVARERVSAWHPVAADQRIRLEFAAQPASARLTDGYLEQILDNLLDNALAATPAGGTVLVAVTSTAADVSVTVSDTGRGMTAGQRDQAMRRWTTDRAGNGGTGLGLTIVRRLAETDHGTVTLSDGTPSGLTARVSYPA